MLDRGRRGEAFKRDYLKNARRGRGARRSTGVGCGRRRERRRSTVSKALDGCSRERRLNRIAIKTRTQADTDWAGEEMAPTPHPPILLPVQVQPPPTQTSVRLSLASYSLPSRLRVNTHMVGADRVSISLTTHAAGHAHPVYPLVYARARGLVVQ